MSYLIFVDLANLKLNDSIDSDRNSETQPLLQPTLHPVLGPSQQQGTTQILLGSGGSGGSGGQPNIGGIWGAAPTGQLLAEQQSNHPSQQQGLSWDMPWTGPPSGGSGSNTTYGPIYNPAAPPPSANNYVTVPHGYQQGAGYMPGVPPTESSYGYQQQPQPSISSSGTTSMKAVVLSIWQRSCKT